MNLVYHISKNLQGAISKFLQIDVCLFCILYKDAKRRPSIGRSPYIVFSYIKPLVLGLSVN